MSDFTNIHDTLVVKICHTVKEAIDAGFVYSEPEYEPIRVTQVVVVKHGMESGADTVDFLLEDRKGQKYMFMITASLLNMIPAEGTP